MSSCAAMLTGYVERLVTRDGARKDTKRRCVLTFSVFVVTLLASLTELPRGMTDSPHMLVGAVYSIIACSLMLGYLVKNKHVSDRFVHVVTVVVAIKIMWNDMSVAVVNVRHWPLFVLLVDYLLLVRAPRWLSTALMATVLLYLVLVELDLAYRYGLLDQPGMFSQEYRRTHTQCEEPPCGSGDLIRYVTHVVPQVLVFMIDFMWTRGFADKVKAEQEINAAAIETAQHIAYSLVRFDLEDARAYLMASDKSNVGKLPEALRRSLEELLDNLASYRPYLPQSCFPDIDELDKTADASAKHAATLRRASSFVDNLLSACPATDASGVQHEPSRFDAESSSANDSNSWAQSTEFAGTPRLTDTANSDSASIRVGGVHATPHVQSHLRSTNIALLQVTFNLAQPTDGFAEYMHEHEDILSAIIPRVNDFRGAVDCFEGGVFHISFNVSRSVPRYSSAAIGTVNALSAVSSHRHSMHHVVPQACGAIVAGPAIVGNLGTTTLRRPTIISDTTAAMNNVVTAAMLMNMRWVCTQRVYDDAFIEYRMKIVLHKVYVDAPAPRAGSSAASERSVSTASGRAVDDEDTPVSRTSMVHGQRRLTAGGSVVEPLVPLTPTRERTPMVMYEIMLARGGDAESEGTSPRSSVGSPRSLDGRRTHVSDCASPTSCSSMEWMYKMSHAGGRDMELHNDVGRKYLTRGLTAAQAYLAAVNATDMQRGNFFSALAAAKVYDLAPRVTRDTDMR